MGSQGAADTRAEDLAGASYALFGEARSEVFLRAFAVGRRIIQGWRREELEKGYDLVVELVSEIEGGKEEVYRAMARKAAASGITVVALLEAQVAERRRYKRAGEVDRRLAKRGARYTAEGLQRKRDANKRMVDERRAQYQAQRAAWAEAGNEQPFVVISQWRKAGPHQFKPRAGVTYVRDGGQVVRRIECVTTT